MTREWEPVVSGPQFARDALRSLVGRHEVMRRLAILAVFALAGCSSTTGPTTAPQATAMVPGSAAPSTAAVASAEPPVVAASPAPVASAASTTPTFSTITLSGSSDKVAKFTKPAATVAIAVVSYRGADNFSIESLNASGGQNDLLVNTIGSYGGTVLFDVSSDSVAFQVTASGPWKIVIRPLSDARPWSGSGTVSGKGDDVLLLSAPTSGLTPATIKNSGQDNFVVTTYTNSQSSLLVNVIGPYNGEVPLPDGTLLVSVLSTGAWSIKV